jgi:RND family efflux transporter MFP subunit
MNQSNERLAFVSCLALVTAISTACSHGDAVRADEESARTVVGVTEARRMPLARELTLSSELVPFQEIDVYAKEAGYVQQLLVDYGTRVKKGQLMAVLEIPELVAMLDQDKASIQNASDQIRNAEHELNRVQAQYKVAHLIYQRLSKVAETKPGLVAQQEVDDAEGKDLAGDAQVEASKAALAAARSQLTVTQAKLAHDQALYDYARITAPFAGVVTQRYANLGTLMQAGTASSTQAQPLVRLSEDDLFRLVIPVPESYVPYIRIGDPVEIRISSLDRTFPGKVIRFSVDVRESTRTMHTEVDVPNPNRLMVPGMYAEATLRLDRKSAALVVPLQAIDRAGDRTTVMVVAPDNRIEERTVTLGVQNASFAEVLSGVRDGERVVMSDRSALKPGEVVQPKPAEVMTYKNES